MIIRVKFIRKNLYIIRSLYKKPTVTVFTKKKKKKLPYKYYFIFVFKRLRYIKLLLFYNIKKYLMITLFKVLSRRRIFIRYIRIFRKKNHSLLIRKPKKKKL